jgi:small subunit ribosomal protein S16
MAVKIRMTRMGRRHRPFFRINAIDSRTPRDGRVLERLGHYDPLEKNVEKQLVLDKERVEFWLGQGAIPSETVGDMLKKNGITCKIVEERDARLAKARILARKQGKLFNKADRAAAEKAAAAAKAAADAEAKAKAAQA